MCTSCLFDHRLPISLGRMR